MSRRNRRQFLQDSMVATAAAVAAGDPAELIGDEDSQNNRPSTKLGVAIAGLRGRGGSHIGAFAGRRDAEILYLCDADRDLASRCEQVAKRQGRRPQFVEDLRTALEDPRVDVVSIATPNHWHALMSIWALQAGKDVYVETPVSHNVCEGRRIVEAARKYQRICQTGTQCRSNPGMIEAMEYVHSGQLGPVMVARGLCYRQRVTIGGRGEYSVPGTVNYDLWLGPAPHAPLTRPRFHYDWHWQWPYGNGDLGNQGLHQMDLARWGLGVQHLSQQVVSYGGPFEQDDAGETANTQVVVHDYGERSLVFEVRGHVKGRNKRSKAGIILECRDGYLVMTSYTSGAAFDLEGRKLQEFSGGGGHLHFANFLHAVRSRNLHELNADIEEGHLSSALCHLGNISFQLGQTVARKRMPRNLQQLPLVNSAGTALEWSLTDRPNDSQAPPAVRIGPPLAFDATTERFADSDEANALLTRPYREPYTVPSAGQV